MLTIRISKSMTRPVCPPGRFRLTAIGMICRKTITDAALARFKNCKSLKGLDLDLTASPVTNAGLAHFNGCQQLTSLVLRGSQHVTDAGLAHFQDRDLTRLVLHSELMTNVGLETFRHCKNLKDLDLNMSQATDTGAAVFKDCSLIHLTLRRQQHHRCRSVPLQRHHDITQTCLVRHTSHQCLSGQLLQLHESENALAEWIRADYWIRNLQVYKARLLEAEQHQHHRRGIVTVETR